MFLINNGKGGISVGCRHLSKELEDYLKYLSQIKDNPITSVEELLEIYNDSYGPSKLKVNIGKILNCKGENIDRKRLETLVVPKSLNALNDLLLSFGGVSIVPPRGGIEEDLKKLFERGQLWIAHGVKRIQGAESQCHYNSSRLWKAMHKLQDMHLATGYALDEEGFWVQHSWCLKKNPRSVNPIETTSPVRLAYFGYALTDAEAEEFYFEN